MDPVKTWSAVLSEIELKVSRPMFAAFFAKTRLDSFRDGVATITVSNPLIKEVVESRYAVLIKDLLEKQVKTKTKIFFKVGVNAKTEQISGPLFSPLSSTVPFAEIVYRSHLNFLFTFENFCVSSSNQMAYAAARAVAQTPGRAYNPLFLYGGVGVGKTHLMQAIGIELLKNNVGMKVLFCSGEEFTNEIIDAIRSKTTYKFKDKFRNAHVLLIDDVQFIAGKNAVQEEFFYTFNTIQRRGSQIILTCDRPPSEISKLEERLRSRFEGGLLIDIQQPDFELRSAIILIKAKQRNIDLPMDVAQELAQEVSDARRLEGSLIRLITEAEVRKQPISLSLVHQLFGKKTRQAFLLKPSSPGVFLIAVAKHYGIRSSLLRGDTRVHLIALPRQVLMYLLRTELGLSLNEVGALLGGRDHTTVMYGVEKIKSLLLSNEDVRNDLYSIKTLVGEK